ncbi:hypothetical protein EV361DRAFT_112038 [Lentinula raphanica]|nr:hypothetical protein EV361DRAFT_112038 [Lentinula raphanica]
MKPTLCNTVSYTQSPIVLVVLWLNLLSNASTFLVQRQMVAWYELRLSSRGVDHRRGCRSTRRCLSRCGLQS